MNSVDPIRDKEILDSIAGDLKAVSERDYMIFLCGLYTGRRIQDILKFRVSDLRKKIYIFIRETKTKKCVRLPLSKDFQRVINEYIKDMSPGEYIFKTPQSKKNFKPMDRSTFYKILNKAAKKYGLDRIGCHSMRKTFGYHHYKEFKDAVMLMEIFGHADISVTLRYIGINQESIDKTMQNFKLLKI